MKTWTRVLSRLIGDKDISAQVSTDLVELYRVKSLKTPKKPLVRNHSIDSLAGINLGNRMDSPRPTRSKSSSSRERKSFDECVDSLSMGGSRRLQRNGINTNRKSLYSKSESLSSPNPFSDVLSEDVGGRSDIDRIFGSISSKGSIISSKGSSVGSKSTAVASVVEKEAEKEIVVKKTGWGMKVMKVVMVIVGKMLVSRT
jgi:hypothetical protein